jgi:hypothetical protein
MRENWSRVVGGFVKCKWEQRVCATPICFQRCVTGFPAWTRRREVYTQQSRREFPPALTT